MVYNHFGVNADPTRCIKWPSGGGFQPIDIYIDGKLLLDLVREVEEPLTNYTEGDGGFRPGDYLSLPASLTYLPNRNFFDEPWNHYFQCLPGDIHYGKSTLLGCTCGIIECWFIVARISLTPTIVTWSHFGQFHRNYEYDLGPFIFERKQYEHQLTAP